MFLLLALAIVTAATVATAAAPSELSTTARAVAGYRSVAYFPNWVPPLSLCLSPVVVQMLILCRRSTRVTSIRRM